MENMICDREPPEKFAGLRLREKVQDMRPLDALEFVLQAWEDMTGHGDDSMTRIIESGFTPFQAILYSLFDRHKGRTVPRERLHAVMLSATGRYMTDQGLNVRIHALRGKVSMRGQKIVTVRGIGYKLVDLRHEGHEELRACG